MSNGQTVPCNPSRLSPVIGGPEVTVFSIALEGHCQLGDSGGFRTGRVLDHRPFISVTEVVRFCGTVEAHELGRSKSKGCSATLSFVYKDHGISSHLRSASLGQRPHWTWSLSVVSPQRSCMNRQRMVPEPLAPWPWER